MPSLQLNQLPTWLFSYVKSAQGKFNPEPNSKSILPERKKKHVIIVYPYSMKSREEFNNDPTSWKLSTTSRALRKIGFVVIPYFSQMDTENNRDVIWEKIFSQYGYSRKSCITIGFTNSTDETKKYIELYNLISDTPFSISTEKIKLICNFIDNRTATIETLHFFLDIALEKLKQPTYCNISDLLEPYILSVCKNPSLVHEFFEYCEKKKLDYFLGSMPRLFMNNPKFYAFFEALGTLKEDVLIRFCKRISTIKYSHEITTFNTFIFTNFSEKGMPIEGDFQSKNSSEKLATLFLMLLKNFYRPFPEILAEFSTQFSLQTSLLDLIDFSNLNIDALNIAFQQSNTQWITLPISENKISILQLLISFINPASSSVIHNEENILLSFINCRYFLISHLENTEAHLSEEISNVLAKMKENSDRFEQQGCNTWNTREYDYLLQQYQNKGIIPNRNNPAQSANKKPNSKTFYGGPHLPSQLSNELSGKSEHTNTRIEHFNYISDGEPPAWADNLARMSLGRLYELKNALFFSKKKFIEKTNITVKRINPVRNLGKNSIYLFEVTAASLVDRKLDNKHYLLPLNHPCLELISCEHGEVYCDQYGRWLLKTSSLNQTKIILGINKKHEIKIFDDIISYGSVRKLNNLDIDENSKNIINNFFSMEYNDKDKETKPILIGYSACNEKNISCEDRAKSLYQAIKKDSNVFLTQDGAHTFLCVQTRDKKIISIDLGGSNATTKYLPGPTNVQNNSNAIKPSISSKLSTAHIYLNTYQTLLNKFKVNLEESLTPKKPDFTQPFNKNSLLIKGVHILFMNPLKALKTISQYESKTAWAYFPDANEFLKHAKNTLNNDSTYIINLSPWLIMDQGERDTLRVKLHEILIREKDHLSIILLSEDAQSILEDASACSRIQYFYNAIETIDKTPMAGLTTSELPIQPLDIRKILNTIYDQLHENNTHIVLSIFYSEEDDDTWEFLEEIIQETTSTGAIYANEQWYYFNANKIQISLNKHIIDLQNLKDEVEQVERNDANNDIILPITPLTIDYFLIPHFKINTNETVYCYLTQAISKQAEYRLLTQAKESNIKIVFKTTLKNTITIKVSNNPPMLAKQNNVQLVSVSELSGAQDLFIGSSLVNALVSGKNVILYADKKNLDEDGNLQQLLIPLLIGFAIDTTGTLLPFQGSLELMIHKDDTLSRELLHWADFEEISMSENITFIEEKSELPSHDHRTLDIDTDQITLPSLEDTPFILPDEKIIDSERMRNIKTLWAYLENLKKRAPIKQGALLTGPSAIAKSVLVETLATKIGYSVYTNITEYKQANGNNLCILIDGQNDELESILLRAQECGHLVILNEINTLDSAAQATIVAAFKEQEGKNSNGFGIIGTLNKASYAGRENCSSALQALCLNLSFSSYNTDELNFILQKKLSRIKINNKMLPEKLIADILQPTAQILNTKEGAMRFFGNTIVQKTNELKILTNAQQEAVSFKNLQAIIHNLLTTLESEVLKRGGEASKKLTILKNLKHYLDDIGQDVLTEQSRETLLNIIARICHLNHDGEKTAFRVGKSKSTVILEDACIQNNWNKANAHFKLSETEITDLVSGEKEKIEAIIATYTKPMPQKTEILIKCG